MLFLFALIEIGQLIHTIWRYRHRDQRYEKERRRKDEWRIWTRGYQVSRECSTAETLMIRVHHPLTRTRSQFLCTLASAVLAGFLFIPFSPGISVVNDVRGKFAWLLILGIVICGVLCLWHATVGVPRGEHWFQEGYRRYVFYIVVEVLAATASLGICSVSSRPHQRTRFRSPSSKLRLTLRTSRVTRLPF